MRRPRLHSTTPFSRSRASISWRRRTNLFRRMFTDVAVGFATYLLLSVEAGFGVRASSMMYRYVRGRKCLERYNDIMIISAARKNM